MFIPLNLYSCFGTTFPKLNSFNTSLLAPLFMSKTSFYNALTISLRTKLSNEKFETHLKTSLFRLINHKDFKYF